MGYQQVSKIIAISSEPLTLFESHWNCGCPDGHAFTEEERERMELVKVDVTKDNIIEQLRGADAVVSCLGTRQFFLGADTRVGKAGTENIVKACDELDIKRAVVMSSVGIEEDWPAVEWHFGGKIMSCLFLTLSRREYHDLAGMEKALKGSHMDYLIVRPVGLGEDVLPAGEWFLQQKKGADTLGINMAKIDCARFMVKEALNPTLHHVAAVVGAKE